MGTPRTARFRHRLALPERAAATWLIGRQRADAPTSTPTLERALGAEGVALLACLFLWGVTGIALVIVGLLVVMGSGGHGVSAPVGWALSGTGVLGVSFAHVRATQMRRTRLLLHHAESLHGPNVIALATRRTSPDDRQPSSQGRR